jgi:hypothetical protein
MILVFAGVIVITVGAYFLFLRNTEEVEASWPPARWANGLEGGIE